MNNVSLTFAIVIGCVAVIALVVAGFYTARYRRTQRLRDRFGPEYDRSVAVADDRRQAEADLRDRERRHRDLQLRPLDAERREQFEHRWIVVQGEFVDDPGHAVQDADRLVTEVMSARGYPAREFDERADDLSVRYPSLTQHYREAQRISRAREQGQAGTEDLRQAVTSYRSLVVALLDDGDPERRDSGNRRTEQRDTEQRDTEHRDSEQRRAEHRDEASDRADTRGTA